MQQSAYETLYALMESSFSRINSPQFWDRLVAGLNENTDVKTLCNLMLSRVVPLDPKEVSRRLGDIADALRATLATTLKDNAVKQEYEKLEENVRSALRVTLLIVEH